LVEYGKRKLVAAEIVNSLAFARWPRAKNREIGVRTAERD